MLKEVYKKWEGKTEDSFDFRNLADSICKHLKDKELLREVYKKWEGKTEDRYDFRYLADSLIKNLGDKKWAKKLYEKENNSTEEMIPIDFISLKSDMDRDENIIFENSLDEDSSERILLTLSSRGSEGSDYILTVEIGTTQQDEEDEEDEVEEEYSDIGSFGCSLNEIKDALKCYLNNGGTLDCFSAYELEK